MHMRGSITDITERKQTEANHRRLASVVIDSNDAITIQDFDGNITAWNKGAEKMYGYSEAEVLRMNIRDIVPEDKQSEALDFVRRLQEEEEEEEEVESFESQRLTKDGKVLDVWLTVTKLVDENGKTIDIATTERDITERKQTEANHRRLASVVIDSNDAITIQDFDGNITAWNKGAEKMYGYSEAEALRMNIQDIVPEDKQSEALDFVRRLQEEEEEVESFESQRLTKDGKVLDVWLTVTKLVDENGKTIDIATTERDITERKQALRESKEKLNLIIDTSPIGICTVDPFGSFVTTNVAYEQMLGYSKEELGGLTIFDITDPDNRLKNKKLFQDMFSLKTNSFFMEKKYIRKDDTMIDVAVYATGIVDAEGNAMFGTAFVEDITERLSLQAQLIQAQKMESVGRLAGGVAHDFNNMLSIIIGYGELVLEKVNSNDSMHSDITEILSAANRSTDITRQLLAFARQQTIAPKVLDPNEIIENMLKMLRRLIGEDIDLAWLPETNVWPVKIDPSQIDQILANLCVNARDAIADVGKVTIETKNISFDEDYCSDHAGFVPGEYIMLAVSDDGSGIEPKTRDKIFEPFFTTKGMGKGTGLGLATVYGIIKQNNGFINVYSELDKGTTIKVYLSRYTGKTVEEHSENTMEIPLSRGETILLVEDEESILSLSKRILEDLGYTVLATNSPNDSLRLIKEHVGKLNLLITDVVMPEMNGLELSKQLQSLYPNIKILFMSGYTANVIVHRGVLEEGVCFIPKPFSKKDLALKVRESLDSANI